MPMGIVVAGKIGVFISYARADGEEHAEDLYIALTQHGFDPWLDKHSLDLSKDWTAQVDNAIENTSCMIVCLTAGITRDDSFVRRENRHAEIAGKPIIVLRFQETNLPTHLQNLTWIDFLEQPWNKAFSEFLEKLAKLLQDNDPSITIEQLAFTNTAQSPSNNDTSLQKARTVSATKSSDTAISFDIEKADPFSDYLLKLNTEIEKDLTKPGFSIISPYVQVVEAPLGTTSLSGRPVVRGSQNLPHVSNTDISFLRFDEAFKQYDERILLIGEPGAGKSTTLMSYAQHACKLRIKDAEAPLPIFARISVWPRNSSDFLAWLVKENFTSDLQATVVKEIEEGNVLLLLDGLDELDYRLEDSKSGADYDPYERLVQIIQQLPDACQILITCRIKIYEEIKEKITALVVVKLRHLNDIQLEEYLRNYPRVLRALETDEQLREMLRIPLLLFMFAATLEETSASVTLLRDSQPEKNEPNLSHEGLDKFIKYLYEIEEEKPISNLPYSLNAMKEVLGHLAVHFVLKVDDCFDILGLRIMKYHEYVEFQDHFSISNIEAAFAYTIGWQQQSRFLRKLLSSSKFRKLLLRIQRTFDFSNKLSPKSASLVELVQRLHLLIPSEKGGFQFIHPLIRDYFAASVLIEATQDKNWYVRKSAIQALDDVGDERAVEPLINALRSKDELTQALAAIALGKIGHPCAVSSLIEALEAGNTDAAIALGKIGGSDAVAALVKALNDQSKHIRWQAAKALVDAGNEDAVEPLMTALNDPDKLVRKYAAKALGRCGDQRAVIPLISRLHEPNDDEDVQGWVVEVLGEIGDPRAIQPLITILRDSDRRLDTLVEDALGKMGASGVELLVPFLHDANAHVCFRVLEALIQIGQPAIEAFIVALRHGDLRAIYALARIGEPAVQSLIALLSEPDQNFRHNVIDTLKKIETPQAQAALTDYWAAYKE